ncbi:MAG: aminotransferase IV [Flavobacteriales bacterium]|nr:aminotransferase IV [Flavobacteriales bacterium]
MPDPNIPLPDERNRDIYVWIDGVLYPRDEAKVSVFDSTVQGGDAVWEGIRVYDGRVFALDEHIQRMHHSAKAMAFTDIPSKEYIENAVFECLKANGMYDEAHIRLTLSRGMKTSSGMSPHFNRYGSTLIVLAEWKKPVYDNSGIRIITSAIRRNNPSSIDSKIHHNNLINNILAKIEANMVGMDAALMLDMQGFVSECNGTNVFVVRDGQLLTPHADSCLPGITRRKVIELALENNIGCMERNISISEVYSAEEVFVTGSMGEVTPVLEVDGRVIGEERGKLTAEIMKLYQELTAQEGKAIPR